MSRTHIGKGREKITLVAKEEVLEFRRGVVVEDFALQNAAGNEGEMRADEFLVLFTGAHTGPGITKLQLTLLALVLNVGGDGEVDIAAALRHDRQHFFKFFVAEVLQD